MRIIKESTLREFATEYPDAAEWLKQFTSAVRHLHWESLQDVRRMYPHADAVTVGSGKTLTVFNVKGNRYRLVMAMHYNRGKAYVRRFMTHAEYSKGHWKKTQ
jgi:mRNA interferase HigB